MRRSVYLAVVAAILSTAWLTAQPAQGSIADGFRLVEVASVSDAMEQLYGQRAYMSHEMRPLAPAKFAGPAVTVLLKKEEHKEGSAASQGMLDAIDGSPAGSVYVMVLEDGADYPSTTINHYRVTGVNVPVTCAGVRVNPGDIVTADEDGIAVVPQGKAADVLKKSQELDDTEHRMIPFIEKFRSIKEAVKQFGRI